MLRTVCAALPMAVRIASSTLVELLPTISLSRYTWSLTVPPRPPSGPRPWHDATCRAAVRRTPQVGDRPHDVRSSGGREYVVRQISGGFLLRRLRHVRTTSFRGAFDDRSGFSRRPRTD